jgi:signal transduction histidine kinase/tetratricopeptide (TPR) repeat protein
MFLKKLKSLNKILVFSIFFACILSLTTHSQNNESFKSDTAKVNKYVDLCGNIIFNYPDSANKYIDSILSLSEKSNYKYGFYKGNNFRGMYYWVTNDLENAIISFKKSLKYSYFKDNPRTRAVVLSNLGMIYSNSYKSDSAIHYLNRTINYSEEHKLNKLRRKALFDLSNLYINQDNYLDAAKNLFTVEDLLKKDYDSVLSIYVYSSFGILYQRLNNFELALENYKKAIEIDENVESISSLANTYINIGELFIHTANMPDSALFYYRKALESALPFDKANVMMALNLNKGNVFLESNQLDSARVYYQFVLNDSLIDKFPERRAGATVNMGMYYLLKKDYDNARFYLTEGHTLSDSLGILHYVRNALQSLIKLDSVIGNYQGSLRYYKVYHKVSDNMSANKANLNIAVLEIEKFLALKSYNNEILVKENNYQNRLIQQQRKVIVLSSVASLFLLILLYTLYRNRRKIKELLRKLSIKHNDSLKVNTQLVLANSQLEKNKKELKELISTKDKFFSILGHDLKSPFNSLLGFLSLFENQWDIMNDEKKKELMQILYSDTKRTYNLLENLLNWSKVQQGLLVCKNKEFKALEIVNQVVDLLETQSNEKQLHLIINVDENLTLNTDPRLFAQLIQNFVNNAIKYTNRNGNIIISAKKDESKIMICVEDNGIGIPNEKINSIFNLDSDFNRVGTDNEKSTGMGLILSKEYANLMGAEVFAESEVGKGSKFCFVLPLKNI